MVAPQQKPEPVANPDVCVDDHVYFQHRAGPQAAQVKAVGKNGITVHHDGKPHRVRWEHVLGHKSRAAQQYSVLEEGEDGMIVADTGGKRRYLNIPPEARGEKMVLGKAFGAGGRLAVFVKAGPIKNRPGLHVEQKTDKNGVASNRWVRTSKDLPKQQPSHVAFKNGEHSGQGKVIASGKHGHTVEDAAGGQHRVPHEYVTHEWHGDGEPSGKPADASVGHGILSDYDVDSLPDKVNQPFNDWDSLLKGATEGLAQYREILGKVQKDMGLVAGMKPKELTPEQWKDDKGYLFIGSLKGADRAKEKVEADYNGDWSQLRDMVRATISVPSMDDVKTAMSQLKAAGIELAQKPKDRFSKPTSEGYRDLMMIVKLPNGMLAELQVHVKAMTLAKKDGHHDYETTRSLQGKYKEDEPSSQWTDEDHTKFYDALKVQKDLYAGAWSDAESGSPATQDDKPLTKSDQCGTMIILMKRLPNAVY